MYYGQNTTTPITVKKTFVDYVPIFSVSYHPFIRAANKVFAQATVTASFKNATLSVKFLGNPKTNRLYFVYSNNDVKQIKVQNLNINNEK